MRKISGNKPWTKRTARKFKKDLAKSFNLNPNIMDLSDEACQKTADFANTNIVDILKENK